MFSHDETIAITNVREKILDVHHESHIHTHITINGITQKISDSAPPPGFIYAI